jgi:hypothetical protein
MQVLTTPPLILLQDRDPRPEEPEHLSYRHVTVQPPPAPDGGDSPTPFPVPEGKPRRQDAVTASNRGETEQLDLHWVQTLP